MNKKLLILCLTLLCQLFGSAQLPLTFLKGFDPNPQDILLYDNSQNIWSIGHFVYFTNLIGDANNVRQVQIFKVDINTREIVKQISLSGPQIDMAVSSRGGYVVTSDQHILITGEWADFQNTRMRTFLLKLDKDLNIIWVNYFLGLLSRLRVFDLA